MVAIDAMIVRLFLLVLSVAAVSGISLLSFNEGLYSPNRYVANRGPLRSHLCRVNYGESVSITSAISYTIVQQ